VLIGRIFHDVAAIFRSASVVALENNLDLLDKKSDFIRLRTSANTVYSMITMLIAFVASYMFNLNPYLPMIGCITTCTLGFVLSLLMRDCSKYDKIPRSETRGNTKIAWSKFVVFALLAYFVFYPIVNSGQSEGKLFIQQHLLLAFDKEKTALIIGAVVCVSRIVRVLSNVIFSKLYEKYQVGMGMILSVLLCLSIGFITFGSFVTEIAVKIVIMAMGYVIILFVRDPFKLYIQDVVFEHTAKEQHQTLLAVLEFGVKIVGACMGLAFSAILVGYPMVTVMLILYAVSVIEILLCLRLYRIVWVEKKQKSVS
ncbi:MAG: hypothetical protein IKC59_08655, partial [Clostridia bacterium]|nr:hypothetical protein [Clostridia bacterium]